MNLKYRIKFNITNLDTQELRDFKISLVESSSLLEFDTDVIPRIPNKSDIIKICGRRFEIKNSDIEYITENENIYNVFNFFIEDIEKTKRIEQEKKNEELNRILKLKRDSYSRDSYSKYSDYSDYSDYVKNDLYKKLNEYKKWTIY